MEALLSTLTMLALLSTLIFFVIFIVRAIKKQKKKLHGIIALISFIVLCVAAIVAGQLYPVENKAGLNSERIKSMEETIESNKTISMSPINFTAYGNFYTITNYEITKNEQGNTIITVISRGFDKLPFRNGNLVIPVWCAYISAGKEIDANSASASSTSVVYFFETSDEPETILFYPADNPDNRIEILIKK
jgi:hypothetical protein